MAEFRFIAILKKILKAIKYLMTLKWLFDIISKLNSVYGKLIYKTKYFKSFAIIYKLILILGIIIGDVFKTKNLPSFVTL